MLFMKGNREEPRCGFSKTTVAILAECNAEYQTFDILSDDEVRQGLKTYSEWPTYPQLYVSGELIGGLDIIRYNPSQSYYYVLHCSFAKLLLHVTLLLRKVIIRSFFSFSNFVPRREMHEGGELSDIIK